MAKIISHFEDHPFLPTLDPRSPYLKYLNCMADHGPTFPRKLKKEVKNPSKWRKLAKELASSDRKVNSFLSTTQATDLIQGGVKVNALPEVVTAVVNHRISLCVPLSSSSSAVDAGQADGQYVDRRRDAEPHRHYSFALDPPAQLHRLILRHPVPQLFKTRYSLPEIGRFQPCSHHFGRQQELRAAGGDGQSCFR